MTPEMKKRMTIMLICLGILFGLIFLWKGFQWIMIKHYFATHQNPAVTVSTAKVTYATWQPQLKAVGSMRAVIGVNVTAQLAGMIQRIYFIPGADVVEGDILVQQNADSNIAQLQATEAKAELARITLERDKKQFKIQAISKQQVDTDEQNLKSLRADVAQQTAIVSKLTIKAPFTGRLGISRVNPGQYLNPGDQIVTLQRLDPIYVDFYLPQQALSQLKVGQLINLITDAFGKKIFTGKITTIQPLVDINTRNIEIEAAIPNPKKELTPGMYATVEVLTSKPQRHLTLPQSAVSFNPYGDIVYIVKEKEQETDDAGKPILIAQQVFVTLGETRGDQVMVLKGLREGEIIVTSGQLKLKNGSPVIINNTVFPANNPAPSLSNQHEG